jgi:hypothetical protein
VVMLIALILTSKVINENLTSVSDEQFLGQLSD